MAAETFTTNYESNFDAWSYVSGDLYKEVAPFNRHPIDQLHELYKSSHNLTGLSVLDYGAGPIPVHQISAAPLAKEIVFAEYVEQNRELLRMWLRRDPKAPDWTHYFKYVVQDLEGKDEEETAKRQEQLREVVKAVVSCDITKDPPIENGYEGPYDVIYAGLIIEPACSTLEEYEAAIGRLSKLLKPGGRLVMRYAGVEDATSDFRYYTVGKEKFLSLNVSESDRMAILEKNGFTDITKEIQTREAAGIKSASYSYTVFLTAVKHA